MGEVWLAIALGGAATFALRASFLVSADRLAAVPPWISRVLRQIPPAALAALVLPSIVRPEGTLDLLQPRLAAAVVAAFIAWRTRNVVITLVLGLVGLVALEAIWPW